VLADGGQSKLWAIRWFLTIFVIALAFVPACGGNAGHSGETSTSHASATATPTTPVVAPPVTPGPRTVKWIDLDVGQCIADLPKVELGEVTVTVVDCATPHQAETYFVAPVPVNAAIPDIADRECGAQFPKYTGKPIDNSGLAVTYLVDSNQDRTTIDPTTGPAPSTVICLLEDANGQPLSGSARR
jgi:hypothetical protein